MLRAKHLDEWLKSAVDEELVRLNALSLEGNQPYPYLLYGLPHKERRNDGRLRNRWLEKYRHLEDGGWFCGTVDSLWGCFKPDSPRQYNDGGKVKTIKYEHPPKTPTEIFKLRVPRRIWEKIAKRHGVEVKGDDFWQWAVDENLPITITEGAKKAGSLLTAGIIAIALPGIFGGYRKNQFLPTVKELIPQLSEFCTEGREINFCFDNDPKPQTKQNVNGAIATTGKLFEYHGVNVKVMTWTYPQKGIDDVIMAHGVDALEGIYKRRLPFQIWQQSSMLDLSPYVSLQVNERYLSEGIHPDPNAQVIGIKSAKGTGKTYWLARLITEAIREGQRVLVLTHRIQLGQALCNIFGIDYVTEYRSSDTGGIFGYGLCMDSLHADSQANFNPDDWENAYIVIDEAEQVFWHLLNSSTIKHRSKILDNFKSVLRTAVGTGGKVFLADADLSPVALDYVKGLLGNVIRTWVVENTFKPVVSRQLINYGGFSPAALMYDLERAIASGEKVLLHTSGQEVHSTWGTQTLEQFFSLKYPEKKILRVDAKTIADPDHPAYVCIPHLNDLLPKYDIVICSPTIETGVSIDIQNHFDSVWCIAWGVQSVDAVCQSLERLREDVPRHIWANTRGLPGARVGSGATSIKALLASTHQTTRDHIAVLSQAGVNDLDIFSENHYPESLLTWAKRGVVVNAGMMDYRGSILRKLTDEGYTLTECPALDTELSKAINGTLKEVRTGNYDRVKEKVCGMPSPSTEDLEKLQNKTAKTEAERLTQQKGELEQRYCVEVTPELIERDDNGYYPQLRLHYYLKLGNEFFPERDRAVFESLNNGDGKAFKPDINKKAIGAQVAAMLLLGIDQFLDPEQEFTSESLSEWHENILKYRHQFKNLFGVTIATRSAITAAKTFISVIGAEMIFHRRDSKNAPRVYRVWIDDERWEIFRHWRDRDLAKLTRQQNDCATNCATEQNDCATNTPSPANADTVGDSVSSIPVENCATKPINIYSPSDFAGVEETTPEVLDVAGWLESCGDAEMLGEILQVFASDTAIFTQDVINRAWGLLKEGKRRLLRKWWEVATG